MLYWKTDVLLVKTKFYFITEALLLDNPVQNIQLRYLERCITLKRKSIIPFSGICENI